MSERRVAVDRPSRFLSRLESDAPLISVELRPPRSGLVGGGAMDMWIDLSHSIRRIVERDAFLMLTDSAVGQEEEENLQHLATNLAGEVEPWRIVPFLTCKHPLEYCLRYGDRAWARGLETLTVVGGDSTAGPPRCLPHAHLLRERIRDRLPELALGGWVNLHRPAEEQVAFALDPGYEADYYLTQIVSHHELPAVERWLRVSSDAGLALPHAAGVFYYRNGRREALERLAGFFPVPVDAVEAEFRAGATPERHCARTIVELRRLGIPHVYVCNLGARHGATRYDRILTEVDALS